MTITKLTKTASRKFTDMIESNDELNSRVHATIAKIKAAENQRSVLRPDSDKKAIDDLNDEMARLEDRRATMQSTFLRQSRLITAIRSWLNSLSPAVELRDVEDQRLGEITSCEATDLAIDSARAEIEKLQSARRSVLRAVPPVEALYAAASARVQELADRGRPSVSVDRGQMRIRFPTDSAFGTGSAKEAVAFMAWLHPEIVEAKLRQQIDAMRANDLRLSIPVMPMAERDRRLADLDARILELERQEEYLITMGEDFNLFVPRREDCNPLAILCLTMEKKQPARREVVSALDK
jgi:hypothetical protein